MDSRTCHLSSEVDLLSPTESSIRTEFPLKLEEELRVRIAGRGGGEVIVEVVGEVDMLSPVESSIRTRFPLELEEELRARVAGRGGGEVMMEVVGEVDLPSPAESNIRTSFPLELEEELRARIAGRGGGEVVVEAIGEGVVEVASGQGLGQLKQGAQPLVPKMCARRRPGDLKALFVRNLRKVTDNGSFKGACAVRAAQIALVGDGQLERIGVLGQGGFGTVSAVRHPVLPGEFALKTLREVRSTFARSGNRYEERGREKDRQRSKSNRVECVASHPL